MISEKWILAQATALLDRGQGVDLYARRASGQLVVHADVTKYGLMNRTHFFELPMTRSGRSIRAAAALARNLPRRPKAMLKCVCGAIPETLSRPTFHDMPAKHSIDAKEFR